MKRVNKTEKIKATDLLSIQKLVFLMDDWHYDQFYTELKSVHAQLPAKLLDIVKTHLPNFDSHEDLCIKIYGGSDPSHRANFNQLTQYTFRLSEFLAVNHPSYLIHNIQKIQSLISEMKYEDANFLAQVLLSLACKIEDFSTQTLVLKFLTQQEHIFKNPTKAEQYHSLLIRAQENDLLLNQIYYIQRTQFNMALMSKKKKEEEIVATLEYLQSLYEHSSASIAIFSKYLSIYITYYFRFDLESKVNLVEMIDEYEKELSLRSYVVFPYLHDIKSSIYLIKINMPEFQQNAKMWQNEIAKLKKHVTMIKYWQTYLNIPELYTTFNRAYTYLNQYSNLMHKEDYSSLLPTKTSVDIKDIIAELELVYQKHAKVESYNNDMMILRELKGGLMLILGGDNTVKGLEEIEMNITLYQQVKKSRGANSYAMLMLGHFGRGDYQKCIAVYNRYLKASKNKDIHEGNDLYLQIYLYLSKWLLNHKADHIDKLKAVYIRTMEKEHFQQARELTEDLIRHFKLPMEIMT